MQLMKWNLAKKQLFRNQNHPAGADKRRHPEVFWGSFAAAALQEARLRGSEAPCEARRASSDSPAAWRLRAEIPGGRSAALREGGARARQGAAAREPQLPPFPSRGAARRPGGGSRGWRPLTPGRHWRASGEWWRWAGAGSGEREPAEERAAASASSQRPAAGGGSRRGGAGGAAAGTAGPGPTAAGRLRPGQGARRETGRGQAGTAGSVQPGRDRTGPAPCGEATGQRPLLSGAAASLMWLRCGKALACASA